MLNLRGASPVGRGDGVGRSYVARRTADAGRVMSRNPEGDP